MVGAEPMHGARGSVVTALPHDELQNLVKKYNRLATAVPAERDPRWSRHIAPPSFQNGFDKPARRSRISALFRPRFVRITRHFHEKAGSCQALVWVVSTVGLHCRPNGRHDGASSLSFLEMGFWVRAIPTADRRRPEGDALCLRFLQQLPSPTGPTSIRSLFCGAIASVPAGCFSIWNGCCRLGPELDIAVFQRPRS